MVDPKQSLKRWSRRQHGVARYRHTGSAAFSCIDGEVTLPLSKLAIARLQDVPRWGNKSAHSTGDGKERQSAEAVIPLHEYAERKKRCNTLFHAPNHIERTA